jgi:hypothetical protein
MTPRDLTAVAATPRSSHTIRASSDSASSPKSIASSNRGNAAAPSVLQNYDTPTHLVDIDDA